MAPPARSGSPTTTPATSNGSIPAHEANNCRQASTDAGSMSAPNRCRRATVAGSATPWSTMQRPAASRKTPAPHAGSTTVVAGPWSVDTTASAVRRAATSGGVKKTPRARRSSTRCRSAARVAARSSTSSEVRQPRRPGPTPSGHRAGRRWSTPRRWAASARGDGVACALRAPRSRAPC